MADALKKPTSLYDEDFYAWTQEQAAKLRARATFDNRGDIDWENAAEEIESVGNSERYEIESRMAVLLAHLLKWRYQPNRRSNSWRASIGEQRTRIARRLRQSPSLRNFPAECLPDEFPIARLQAIGETDLPDDRFPLECPFTIEEILDPDFFPDAA